MVLDEKQLLALEDQARLDLEAIQRIRGMMARQNGTKTEPRQTPPPPPALVHGRTEEEMEDFRDYDESESSEPTSLIGTISKNINADPGVRWTTAKVLAHLQTSGYPLQAAKPLYSVGQALGKLVERGEIRILRRGAGSKPNIYAGVVKEDPRTS